MRPFLGLNVPLRAALGFELFIGLSLGHLAFHWPWPSAVEFFFKRKNHDLPWPPCFSLGFTMGCGLFV